jgi:hypothetical protein
MCLEVTEKPLYSPGVDFWCPVSAHNPVGSQLSGGRSQRRGGSLPAGRACGVWSRRDAPSGAMSWTCPRCQQPVYFGKAGDEGAKMGRVRTMGFHGDGHGAVPGTFFHL